MAPSFAPSAASGVGRRYGLPDGFRFYPNPRQMVEVFLIRKVLGLPLPQNEIKEGLDIYSRDPDHLPIDIDNHTDKWAYFFMEKKDVRRRTTPGGYWEAIGDEEEIVGRDDRVVGFKKNFVFCKGSSPDGVETEWEMEEYRVNPVLEELNNTNVHQKDYVVARIYMEIPQEDLIKINEEEFENESDGGSSNEALPTSED